MRLIHIATAAVVAAGAGSLALPAVAQAASPPVVNWAHSAADDPGRVELSASAGSDITSLTAHVVSYNTGQEVAVVNTFTLTSGTAQDGVWDATQLLHLDQLGYYTITVDVTDAAGDQVTQQNVGGIWYDVTTTIDPITVDRTSVDYTHRAVTVSGRLMGHWPGGGKVEPLAGFPVEVASYFDDTVDVTTAADGTFSGVVHINQPDTVYAYYPYDNNHIGYGGSSSNTIDIAVTPSPTRLTAHLNRSTVNAGTPVTISGQLTWKSPHGWRTLPNTQIGVVYCGAADDPRYCGMPVAYPQTDADGRYSVTFTAPFTGFFKVAYGPTDPFVAATDATTSLAVLQPAVFTDITAARTASNEVTVQGHINFPQYGTPAQIPIQIQYSESGDDDWHTVTSVNASWDGQGNGFTATVTSGHSGHWRAYYAGVPSWFQSATSTTVYV